MVKFGDLLGDEEKGEIFKIHSRIGNVYRMPLTEKEGITPKNPDDESRNKYFVIIGNDGAGNLIGFVVINSSINQNLPARIKDYHYPIKAGSYPFLKKDSFINFSQLPFSECKRQ